LRSEDQRGQNVKIVFAQTFVKVNRMINGLFYRYRRIYFTSGNASFLWYLSVIIRNGRISRQPPGHVPTFSCHLLLIELQNNSIHPRPLDLS